MILILTNEDGSTKRFNDYQWSLHEVLLYIKTHKVKTIVAGEVEPNVVIWGKQFNAVTVMPREFGEQS